MNAKPKTPAEKASIFDSKASAMDPSKPEAGNEATIAAMVQKPTQEQIYKYINCPRGGHVGIEEIRKTNFMGI